MFYPDTGLVFATGFLNSSLRLQMFRISWHGPLLMLALSLLVYAVAQHIDTGASLTDFLVKGFSAGAVLVTFLLYIDREVRAWSRLQRLQGFGRSAKPQ